jgi:cephalosporin hydroxylase
MYTKKQFEEFLKESGKKMADNKSLNKKALDLLVEAAEYNWIHQSKWFGEPILNPAQDIMARQEIIFHTKPDYIIELGVAWGGTLLFYSTLMEILGGKKIIGIDKFMPPDLIKRLKSNKKLSKRFILINGGSTEEETLKKVRKIIGKNRKLLIICDSNHTHEHVLKELELYSPLVGKGYYMICDDTFVEDIKVPSKINTDRPWGPGNNPETARREFLKNNKRFEVDKVLENKLLISCNPNGYLKCVKN